MTLREFQKSSGLALTSPITRAVPGSARKNDFKGGVCATRATSHPGLSCRILILALQSSNVPGVTVCRRPLLQRVPSPPASGQQEPWRCGFLGLDFKRHPGRASLQARPPSMGRGCRRQIPRGHCPVRPQGRVRSPLIPHKCICATPDESVRAAVWAFPGRVIGVAPQSLGGLPAATAGPLRGALSPGGLFSSLGV